MVLPAPMNAPTPTPHSPPAQPGPQLPRLYTFRRCPYAMRARMALLQAELASRYTSVMASFKSLAGYGKNA